MIPRPGSKAAINAGIKQRLAEALIGFGFAIRVPSRVEKVCFQNPRSLIFPDRTIAGAGWLKHSPDLFFARSLGPGLLVFMAQPMKSGPYVFGDDTEYECD